MARALLSVSVEDGKGNKSSVTVRLYGPNTALVIDRKKEMQKRVSGSPNTLFRGASRCCHHYPHASPVVCLYPRASGSIAAVDQEAMASLMVGIGNGTTSTPMFVLQLLLWGPKPARLLWVPSSQGNVGLLRGLQYRDRCACSRPLAKKYTLELLFASSPPSVTAAAMKECVLDEYSTKHRISIDRFLQLKIFVKVHDRA
ncbi:hypothetical protein OsJ_32426 [Oryza sativa Japonica Group]|uniref:Uncharacterized protein n=1 Tax=Oryza sativa subsp. japonica TaxID=39947 RepID=B9G6Y2_ORYSJ|nr:hypothetical protein OsJ_32426 [Oryza sativa Japonica Group]